MAPAGAARRLQTGGMQGIRFQTAARIAPWVLCAAWLVPQGPSAQPGNPPLAPHADREPAIRSEDALTGSEALVNARAAYPPVLEPEVSLPSRRHEGWLSLVPPPGPGCPLCNPSVPIVELSSQDVYGVGKSLAELNEKQLASIDSLYQAGCFGSPDAGEAQRAAHLLARLTTFNAYAYVARFATDSTQVYEARESTLVRAFGSFSGPGQYPITRLRRARMGLGRICLQYDLHADLDTLVTLGERRVRVRVCNTDIDGRNMRVLSMMLPTGLDDEVEVLLSDHYTASVSHWRSPGPPAPYELFLIEDIDGFWLRKWGTHRPRALAFWVSPNPTARCALPETPLVGVRVYVPSLKLRLPLLPDVAFDDLREMDLPQPILRLEYLRGSHPSWLQARVDGLGGWRGYGDLPEELRRRFPDQ
jgi:hypothetical protein